jgi:hypothetical protein
MGYAKLSNFFTSRDYNRFLKDQFKKNFSWGGIIIGKKTTPHHHHTTTTPHWVPLQLGQF